MPDNPFDPLEWGIDPVTASDIRSFEPHRGLPRVSAGRFGPLWPSRTVSSWVPDIEEIATLVEAESWYWETKPPHPAFRRIEDVSSPRLNAWTTDDDALLSERWPDHLNEIVDEYISVYQSAWPAAIAVAKPESNPVSRFIHDLVMSDDFTVKPRKGYSRESLLQYKLANALETGPFNVTILRRNWDFPTVRRCVCCGGDHYYDLARYSLIRGFGSPGICAPCMTAARYGESYSGPFERSEILGALRDFADMTKTIPASSFRESVYTAGMSDADRGVVIALLLAIPSSPIVLHVTGCSTWLQVLQAAGIVGHEGWRPARGTICTAMDGHQCRSLAEKAICDWFHLHGVAHEVEPAWPKHPEYNPSGKLRADWSVGSVYIEFAGLMGDVQYREKIGRKVSLARDAGIELIVLQPEDLPRLGSVLTSLVQGAPQGDGGQGAAPTNEHSAFATAGTGLQKRNRHYANTFLDDVEEGDTEDELPGDVAEDGRSDIKFQGGWGSVSTDGRIQPHFVVGVGDDLDDDGNFTVGVFEPNGTAIEVTQLNQRDLEGRLDITLNYEHPATGPCEVRVAIRPRSIQKLATDGDSDGMPGLLDDYGFSDYR